MRKLISIVLSVLLFMGTAPASFAETLITMVDDDFVVTYDASKDSRLAKVTTVEDPSGKYLCRYSDSWFTLPSFDFTWQMAALSSYASMTAGGYKKVEDSESGESDNGIDVTGLLTECGFEDVQSNKYYFLPTEEHSLGVVAGHKVITEGTKKYTLLAVLPFSPGYGQEWSGNLVVGKGGLHEGFKAARDEALRFLKNYMVEHKIKGDIKVWITGHSRFGAVSNLLGGFLAGGGDGYFDKVVIQPNDVFCYTYAPPAAIRGKVATKAEALSVAGARGSDDPRYINDSDGAPYAYEGDDKAELVGPQNERYNGIHNCKPDYDLITQLPPDKWGYGRYGTEFPITDGKEETKERMLEELQKYYPSDYEQYVNGGDEADYKWKTFDFATLSFIDDKAATEPISQAKMFHDRVNNGLARRAESADQYVDGGYEATLSALTGIVGMQMDAFFNGIQKEQQELIEAVLFAYLGYAVERLGEEKGYDEEKAVAVAVEELLEYITGEQINPDTFTVDNFVELISQYIVDNAEYKKVPVSTTTEGPSTEGPAGEEVPADADQYDQDDTVEKLEFKSKAAEKTFNTLANLLVTSVPEDYKAYLAYIMPGYDSTQAPDSEVNKQAAGKFVFTFLSGCAYGVDGNKENPDTENAAMRRGALYSMISLFMLENYSDIVEAIGRDNKGYLDGSGSAESMLDVILRMLMVEKDESGEIIDEYGSVAEAADAFVCRAVRNGVSAALKKYDEGSAQYKELAAHGVVLEENSRTFWQLLMDTLFFDVDKDGEPLPFDTVRNIRYASTFAAQTSNILCAHLNDTYDAWMRAQDTEESMAETEVKLVQMMIDSLPEAEKVQLSDRAEVDAVEAAYKALTDAQKNKISNLSRLTTARNNIDELEKEAYLKQLKGKLGDALNATGKTIDLAGQIAGNYLEDIHAKLRGEARRRLLEERILEKLGNQTLEMIEGMTRGGIAIKTTDTTESIAENARVLIDVSKKASKLVKEAAEIVIERVGQKAGTEMATERVAQKALTPQETLKELADGIIKTLNEIFIHDIYDALNVAV